MRRLRRMGVLPALMSRYHVSLDDLAVMPRGVIEDLLFDLNGG